jgi:hypothetical protein
MRALAFVPLCASAAAPLPQRLGAPSYWYPSATAGSPWARAVASSPPLDLVVINPDSGPGERADAAYVAQVARAHAASATLSVLGYVHTSYGTRTPAEVHADVAAFFGWYDVDGIFVDEVSADATSAPYFAELAAFIRAQRAPAAARGAAKARAGAGAAPLVVFNPGTSLDEAFEPSFDVVMSFEGPLAEYLDFAPAPWLRNASRLAPARIWHCVHSVPEPRGNATGPLADAVARAKALNAGWVYATNETLPNPYARLPGEGFWEDLERWATGLYRV